MSMTRLTTIKAKMAIKAREKSGCQPLFGCAALVIRWAKIRLMTKMSTTPAATKIWAAIASRMFVGLVAHTILKTQLVIRAMQKPKSMPDMRNLCPRLLLTWRIVMLETAPVMKRTKKTAVIGTSTPIVGTPPRPAVVGAYGPGPGCSGE